MSVALLQRFLILTLITVVTAWFIISPAYFPVVVVIGVAFLIVFTYAWILASEFVLLLVYGTEDGSCRPAFPQVVRAWLGEVLSAPRVFCWRQPWRFNAEPDWLPNAPRPGVLLVHGFFCNRAFWNPWMAQLRAAGIPYMAVNLEPMFGSIDSYPRPLNLRRTESGKRQGWLPLSSHTAWADSRSALG